MLKLFRVLRPYYLQLAGVVIVLFGQAMAELSLPTLMADVVNNGMMKGDNHYINTFGAYMLLVALASTCFSIMASFLSSIIGMSFGRDVRNLVFTHVENFSLTEFDKIGTASLITRTTNDITQVQTLLVMAIRFVFYAPIMGIGGVIHAVQKSSSMTCTLPESTSPTAETSSPCRRMISPFAYSRSLGRRQSRSVGSSSSVVPRNRDVFFKNA